MTYIPERLVARVYEFFSYADAIRTQGFAGWERVDMLESAQGTILMYLPRHEFVERMLLALRLAVDAHWENPITQQFFDEQLYTLEVLIEELRIYLEEEIPAYKDMNLSGRAVE